MGKKVITILPSNILLIWTYAHSTGLDKQNIWRKIVYIFLPLIFNICFGWEIKYFLLHTLN